MVHDHVNYILQIKHFFHTYANTTAIGHKKKWERCRGAHGHCWLTSMIPIVWKAVKVNMNPNPRAITFTNLGFIPKGIFNSYLILIEMITTGNGCTTQTPRQPPRRLVTLGRSRATWLVKYQGVNQNFQKIVDWHLKSAPTQPSSPATHPQQRRSICEIGEAADSKKRFVHIQGLDKYTC